MSYERTQRKLNDPDSMSPSRMLVDEYVEAVIDLFVPTKNPAASADTCIASLQPTGSDAGGQTRILMNDDKEPRKPARPESTAVGLHGLLPSPTGYGHSLGMTSVSGGSSAGNPFSTPNTNPLPNDYPCKCYRCSVCGGKQTHPNQPSPYYPQPYIAPYITYNT